MRPVEDVGVQSVVAAAVVHPSLDGLVVVADLAAGRLRVGVEDDAADRVHRPEEALPPLAEEVRVPHAGGEFRMHVLHRPDHRWPMKRPRQSPKVERQRIWSPGLADGHRGSASAAPAASTTSWAGSSTLGQHPKKILNPCHHGVNPPAADGLSFPGSAARPGRSIRESARPPPDTRR